MNHWAIRHDLVDGTAPAERGGNIWESRGFPRAFTNQDLPVEFQLLDDDGNCYFLGRMQVADFDPLDDFGRSYGCTELRYRENGGWHQL
jgi:hypothetical protein